MKVHGIEITPEQIALGLRAMNCEFRTLDVQRALESSGVPATVGDGWLLTYISNRAADRMVQSQKRAGLIAFKKGKWVRL
jgi:hypothetical protein